MQVKLNKWVRGVGNGGDVIDVDEQQGNALICRGVASRYPGGIKRKRDKPGVGVVTQQQDVPEFDDNDQPVNEPAAQLMKEANDHERTSEEESEAEGHEPERATEGA